MDNRFLPYLVTEAFCAAYAGAILLRLRQKNGAGRETGDLMRLIFAYIAMLATDVFSVAMERGLMPAEHYADAALNAVSNAAVVMGCYYWFRYVDDRLAEETSRLRNKDLCVVPALAACALNLVSVFTGWIFQIDRNGQYHEGGLFWAQSAISMAYLLIPAARLLRAAVRTASGEKRTEYLTYVGSLLVPVALVWVTDHLADIPIFALSIFLVIQVLFMTVYLSREERLADRRREMAEYRTAIMRSQIQPHFLYNALSVIVYYCDRDPQRAKEVTLVFSDYLRENLNSLREDDPVPFEEELTHVRNYLFLEKQRFENKLSVVYDIGATDFMLPAISVQPLVANAVRNGLRAKKAGGTVTVSSREEKDCYTVTVRDDGGGSAWDEAEDDDLRAGIRNVKRRIAELSEGSLTIERAEGVGTTATIRIPKEEK